ncbi:hypothetical protein [Mycobacteroides abscessus]|uniref:hypothetical protein n=1 Tax=Mycobacteroides abscessus TaxID=36809 RepID=UPI0018968FD0
MARLRERWIQKQADRGLRWIEELPDTPFDKTEVVHVRGRATLKPLGDADGAIAAWIFDVKAGATQVLFVRLTEDEAEQVYRADPYSVGFLEPVRHEITNEWAVLAVKCGDALYAGPYRIPRGGSEDAFISNLDEAAATCPAFSRDKSTTPSVQTFVSEAAHGFAFV